MRHSFFLLLLAALTLTACLDENPKDQIEAQQTYTSAKDIYTHAVSALYAHIGSNTEGEGLQGTCYGIYDYNTLSTDEALIPIRGGDWYDGGVWQNMYNHTWKASDENLYTVWKYLFSQIVRCNESLATIASHADLLTAAQQREYVAEVRAVRALFYYYAMDMFGRVPIVTSSATPADSVAQAERSVVFRFIFSELQELLPLLDESRSNAEGTYYGHVTRPVAYFLLAKLALNAEVYADDDWTDGTRPDGKQLTFTVDGAAKNAWETCVYYCEQLEDMGYRLAEDYLSNFMVRNDNSLENIFTIPLDKNRYTAEFHYLTRSRYYSVQGGENGTCATIHAMKVHGYGTEDYDPRLYLNYYVDTVFVNGKTVTLDNGEPLVYHPMAVEVNLTYSDYKQTAGARMAKYDVDPWTYADGHQGDNDIVLFRYGDALLMKAEAKLRNDGSGQQEMDLLRARVYIDPIDATLQTILDERLRELSWEGWRRQDLIRFGQYHKAYDLRTPLASESDAHTTVFPIPAKCIKLNPRLTQNKGY